MTTEIEMVRCRNKNDILKQEIEGLKIDLDISQNSNRMGLEDRRRLLKEKKVLEERVLKLSKENLELKNKEEPEKETIIDILHKIITKKK